MELGGNDREMPSEQPGVEDTPILSQPSVDEGTKKNTKWNFGISARCALLFSFGRSEERVVRPVHSGSMPWRRCAPAMGPSVAVVPPDHSL